MNIKKIFCEIGDSSTKTRNKLLLVKQSGGWGQKTYRCCNINWKIPAHLQRGENTDCSIITDQSDV